MMMNSNAWKKKNIHNISVQQNDINKEYNHENIEIKYICVMQAQHVMSLK